MCICCDAQLICAEETTDELAVMENAQAQEELAPDAGPPPTPPPAPVRQPRGPGEGHGELPEAPEGAGDGERSCRRGDGGGCSIMKRL